MTSFPVGPFIISVGGLIVFLGTLLASWTLIRTVRDEEVSLKFLSDHLPLFVVVPLFLGRFGAFLSLWKSIQLRLSDDFPTAVMEILWAFLYIGDGGIRADWALGGFFVTFLILAFWRKQKTFAWLDAFILPGIVISLFVSLGGYISGWGYGRPSPEWLSFPFAVEYNLQDVRYSGKLYAVQMYTAVLSAIIFLVGWRLWQRKIWRRWRPGKFFAVMVFFLGIGNSFLEFFRGDAVPIILGMRLPQILGFAIALCALFFLLLRKRETLLDRIHPQE